MGVSQFLEIDGKVVTLLLHKHQTNMEQAVLENFSKNLFWDAYLLDLDTDKHASYIVGRVLEYGNGKIGCFYSNITD
jgi:hypothetical protein